jgi:adenosylcobinamide-GDP ribazoletransferase
VSPMPAASLRAAAAAVAFLTRVPLGRWFELAPADVGRGVVFFPLVGAGVGALGGLAVEGLDGPLPALAAGALGVALVLCLTGALHVDALADTADALGAPTRERALEIMRDSRIGSFGAAAVAVALLLESSLLAAAAVDRNAVAAFAVAGALSRAASPPLAVLIRYARAEGGPGSVLAGRTPPVRAAVAALVAIGLSVGLLGWDGAAALAVAVGVAAGGGIASRAWIGGATGDTLGAVTQVAEIGVLAVLVGLA